MTGLAGLRYNDATYYYLKNFKNDIIGILDSNYNQIVSYEYDGWGKVLSIKDLNGNEITDNNHIGIINPFRYRSYYYDSETKLYYLNNRYYNPEWKKFISADGIIAVAEEIIGSNLYTYAKNNPISFYDADGEFALSLTAGSIAGALLGAAAAIYAKKATKAIVNVINNIRYSAKTSSKSKTTKTKKTKASDTTGHNVYVLRDRKTGQVEYVGRTTEPKATEYRHSKNKFREKLDIDTIAENISKDTARGLEQMLIMQCGTLKRDRLNPIHNQINGVAKSNKMYYIYWAAAADWASGNEDLIPCK